MGSGSWSQGGVLLGDSQLHPHQEDSVGGGGGSGLFLIVTPFISFALSASILRLPEQTKTGAIRGRGCQSRPKLVPPRLARVLAGRGLSNILPQSVLLFFDSIGWYIFEMCEDGGIYKRLAISCASWWIFFGNHRGAQVPPPLSFCS